MSYFYNTYASIYHFLARLFLFPFENNLQYWRKMRMTGKYQPVCHGLTDPLLPLLALIIHAQNLVPKKCYFFFFIES